jgi:CRISPR/Cas system-associated exonuclease Cas4 (RecB family)
MFYSWHNREKTNPPDSPALFKMNVGDLIHTHLTDLVGVGLDRIGWYVTSSDNTPNLGAEVPFKWTAPGLKYEFSGRMDGRFMLPGGSKGLERDFYLGVEWKSIYGMGVNSIKKDGPKEDALMQCAIYLSQDAVPLDAIALMYACRDNGYFLGFEVRMTHNGYVEWENMSTGKVNLTQISLSRIVDALKPMEENLEIGQYPIGDWYNTPDKANKWRCDYCSWRDDCYGDPE